MKNVISLYHTNFESSISLFKETKELKVSSHADDKEWGGTGMYFWDNTGNAKYWYYQKKKINTASPIEITKCHVEFDVDNDILDLTNYYVEERFQKTLNLLSNKRKLTLSTAPIGDKIDFYCKHFDVKIVKFFGKYCNTPKTSLFDSDDTSQKITNQVKVIYCLKESEINIIKGDIEVVSIEEV